MNVSGFRPLIIFWSQYGNPNKAADSPYTPNHVVPLVASEEGELVVTSPSGPSTEGVERSPQLRITTPSGPSTEGVERLPQLLITRPSGPSTEGVERSPQLLITSPSSPSTEAVERSPHFVVTAPSGLSTEGKDITATIPTTNCNEHQDESSIEKNDRKIQSSWFTTYTWLQLESGMFFL